MNSIFEEFDSLLTRGEEEIAQHIQDRLAQVAQSQAALEVARDTDQAPFRINLKWLVPPTYKPGPRAKDAPVAPVVSAASLREPVGPVSEAPVQGHGYQGPTVPKRVGGEAEALKKPSHETYGVADVSVEAAGTVVSGTVKRVRKPKVEAAISGLAQPETPVLDDLDQLAVNPPEDLEKRYKERQKKVSDLYKKDRGGTV